jgi:hypothetical protein
MAAKMYSTYYVCHLLATLGTRRQSPGKLACAITKYNLPSIDGSVMQYSTSAVCLIIKSMLISGRKNIREGNSCSTLMPQDVARSEGLNLCTGNWLESK